MNKVIKVNPSGVGGNTGKNNNKGTLEHKQKPTNFATLNNEKSSTRGAEDTDEEEVSQTTTGQRL